MKILIIGPQCWGKADSVEEAFNNALKNAPSDMRNSANRKNYRKLKCFAVYKCPVDDTYVDGMGSINWTIPEGNSHNDCEPDMIGYLDIDRKLILDVSEDA
jgi:hypothetical protein